MNDLDEVVTDGEIEIRADWNEPDAKLFWRPLEAKGMNGEGWRPSIYMVGDFDHDPARALRVMSALWRFLEGALRPA